MIGVGGRAIGIYESDWLLVPLAGGVICIRARGDCDGNAIGIGGRVKGMR